MTDEDLTHFHFDFGGITLELSGERQFVEKMYRQVMKDVEAARAAGALSPISQEASEVSEVSEAKFEDPHGMHQAVWVHRCSEMMRKIYMTTQHEINKTIVGRCIDPRAVGVLFVDKGVLEKVFPELEKGQTLWAEFTPAGRQKIAEVTAPIRKALDYPIK